MMKKILILVLSIIILIPLLIILVFSLHGGTYLYKADFGDFKVMYGKYLSVFPNYNSDGVCVCEYIWDGNENHTDIVIPDEYNSRKIKKLGGYFGRGLPSPFYIECVDLDDKGTSDLDSMPVSVPYDMFDKYSSEWSEIVYYDFNLYIGKYIDGIYGYSNATVCTDNGIKTAYCPRVTIYCDEENKTFYSENGKLYYRKNGELVTDFIYTK